MEKEKIISILEEVMDPEIPVLSIADLGILRGVEILENEIRVTVTPTYSGCPAMDTIQEDIRSILLKNGFDKVKINLVLSPAWTSEWMTDSGREKLEAFGIAAPALNHSCTMAGTGTDEPGHCPLCHSGNIEMISRFGSTACKALYRCLDCREPFDYFKCH
ncbi:MAG: 1,2-phenylacetyl-CoA epoxidase subunit PaaD [Bacteroidota bacterium]|nr:1,2-phenylacetyl-CoA epoxidase subunit PaaD [Bacteroidota bacterium]